MIGFSFLLILIVVLLALPLLAAAASVFYWWGEKKEMEDVDREAEKYRREMKERFPEEPSVTENGTADPEEPRG